MVQANHRQMTGGRRPTC